MPTYRFIDNLVLDELGRELPEKSQVHFIDMDYNQYDIYLKEINSDQEPNIDILDKLGLVYEGRILQRYHGPINGEVRKSKPVIYKTSGFYSTDNK